MFVATRPETGVLVGANGHDIADCSRRPHLHLSTHLWLTNDTTPTFTWRRGDGWRVIPDRVDIYQHLLA